MIGLIVITGKWKNRELEGREMSQVPPLSVTGHCRQPRPCLGQVRSGQPLKGDIGWNPRGKDSAECIPSEDLPKRVSARPVLQTLAGQVLGR